MYYKLYFKLKFEGLVSNYKPMKKDYTLNTMHM